MHLPRLFFSMLCIIAFLCQIHAQVPPALAAEFNKTLDSMRISLNVKSLSAAIQLSDNSIWAGATGISSVVPSVAVTPDFKYEIGSVTKTITAACILQLADEGVLKLSDSLHRWLPAFPYTDSTITIRQLLRHQSGLYDVITDRGYQVASQSNTAAQWDLTDMLNTYMKPPLFKPGQRWSYCNTNYALLGLIIESATGNPYYTEFRNRFFKPLKINSLALYPYDSLPSPIAHAWLDLDGNGSLEDGHFFFSNWISFFTSAGPMGGYWATPTDIAIWNRAFLRGDLHSPAIMTEAKTTIPASIPANGRHGLGIMERKFLGLTAYGHGGDIVYSSTTYYFPAKDISIAVLNNDQTKNSWALAPVVQALLKDYLDYQIVSTDDNQLKDHELTASVSPNPFEGSLAVTVDLPYKVNKLQAVLTNVAGTEISRSIAGPAASGERIIPLNDLDAVPPGVYFLRILIDGAVVRTIKVAK